ncbi:MAG: hypothetical protein MJ099_00015 [Clostridia bacterium]|nr:hypothetical protein [Clostridia bacterium]
MARIQIGFYSSALGKCVSCTVVMPEPKNDVPLKTVYLYHNLMRNGSAWTRFTSIERYATEYGIAVVMPDLWLSSARNMPHGEAYYTFLSQELPDAMENFFNLSRKREDTFIAGCSMGAYAAMQVGLRPPERFAAIGGLSSGHLNYTGFIGRYDDRGISLLDISYGSRAEHDAEDARFNEVVKQGITPAPRVFLAIGKQDTMLREVTLRARDVFESIEGNPYDFMFEEPEGGHDWQFWDAHICDFFDYCGLKRGRPML